MADTINSRTIKELLRLTHKERVQCLVEMSTEMLDGLTPVQLENITFDWFRAYHAIMFDSSFLKIKELGAMPPDLRRVTLHNIVLARDDRSIDRLAEPTVRGLRVIFNDRKSKAGHPFFPPFITHAQFPNEFSMDKSFFQINWASQANRLHTHLEGFNLSSDQQHPGPAPSNDRDLLFRLARLRLEDQTSILSTDAPEKYWWSLRSAATSAQASYF